MNTRIYEYMLAVAAQKNITKAAEQCFISQPALTQHIKKLENQFGAPLFEKKGKDLVPTRQGEVFLITAQRMLQIEQETLSRIEELKKTSPQRYRIFTDISIKSLLTEQIWPIVQNQYPNLKLSVLSGNSDDAWDCILNNIVDLGIFPVHGAIPSGIDYILIDQIEYVLLLPPHHPAVPLFSRYGINFHEISKETFILNQPNTFFHDLQKKILDYYHMVPDQILYSHSMSNIPQMVNNGCGISLFPADLFPLIQTQCTAFSFAPAWYFQYVAAYRKSRGLLPYDELLTQLFIQKHKQIYRSIY